MKHLDYPPLWLIGAIALTGLIAKATPGLGFGRWGGLVGTFLIAAGIVLTVAAVLEFRKARTTVIPGRNPSALITSGVFRYSRNPIYLADVFFLTGVIFWWNAVLALPLVPGFIWVIRARFITWEEARLSETFGAGYEAYKDHTGRWM